MTLHRPIIYHFRDPDPDTAHTTPSRRLCRCGTRLLRSSDAMCYCSRVADNIDQEGD